MKLLIFILILATVSAFESKWSNFKKTYKKSYSNIKEERYRKGIFRQNLELIEEHNRKYHNELASYYVQVNHLADQTQRDIFPPSSNRQYVKPPATKTFLTSKLMASDVPDSIDWRDYGVVTPVVNQKTCNSCWAFAITGTLEAHVGIYENRTVSLSQQNLNDCVYSNFTCNDGLNRTALEDSYQYIIDNEGLDTAEAYPYEDNVVGECRYSEENKGASIKSYVEIEPENEEELKIAVATVGPVTVAITTDWTWSIYLGGIYYKEDCLNTNDPFNHAVVVVGYGSEDGNDYWLVKNSWGEWFGDKGYIKMARNRENNCGIASYARYPLMN